MIEPNNINFPLTDFSGGRTGDAWWIKSAIAGQDLWGERKGDEFHVVVSDLAQEDGLSISVGMRGETVGLNLSQQLIVVYDRRSGDLKSFSAGLGMCVLEMMEMNYPLPFESVDQAEQLIIQGRDVMATVDATENKLSFWLVSQAAPQLLGETTLQQALPNRFDYEFATRVPTNFPGVFLDVGLSANKIDLFLACEGDNAVNFSVSRWVDLSEIRKQKHPDLACVRKLIHSTFLTLQTDDHDS